jgi:hypothetical protein
MRDYAVEIPMLPSGINFCLFEAGSFRKTIKMMLVK